jgi:hypothetical protein
LTLKFFKQLSDQWDYEPEEIVAKKEKELGGIKFLRDICRAKADSALRFSVAPLRLRQLRFGRR